MKRILLSLIAFSFLTIGSADAANRYAVAAGGNWTANATWSTTDGGAPDTIAPTASDDVFLTVNSGNVTISATSVGKSLTCTGYTGTLTHNAFTLTISGSITFSAGMTYTPSSSSAILGMNASGTFTSAGQAPWAVTIAGGTMTLGDNLTMKANKDTFFSLNSSTGLLDINGKTLSGNSATNRVLVRTSTLGTARTITNTTGTFANADFRDITFSTAADYSAITGGSGDCGGNTNGTFTTAQTNYWIGGTGNWSDVNEWASTSGGSAASGRVPLPQDGARFDASSFSAGSQTVTADMPRLGKDIDWTGATNTPTFTLGGITHEIYGSYTLISGMTLTEPSGSATELHGRSTHTITSGGKSHTRLFRINSVNGTYSLSDAFSSSQAFSHAWGTYTTNDFSHTSTTYSGNVTAGSVRVSNFGASLITLTAATTSFDASLTGHTINAGTSTILLSDTGASSKTFAGGSKTYYDLKIAGGGAGAVIFTGANTFNRIYTDGGGTKSITLPGSTTTTIASGLGLNNGTNVITFTASSGSATVLKSGGGVVDWEAVNLTNIIGNISGGATYYAGQAPPSVNGGGNTNWSFTDAPSGQAYSLLLGVG